MQTGTVFNIQRYSIDDGPGIRTTVFVKGCPLVCPWCSNPESQSAEPQLQYRVTACAHCGACAAACPSGAITVTADSHTIDRARCTVCGVCVRVCEYDALKISGEEMSVDKVWKTVRKDTDYYETSGGGVTCSGGEILAQPEFVREIFEKCRENGVHTCADTSGYGTEEAMRRVLEFADLVFFDIKHSDPARHLALTGVPLETVLANLRLCAGSGVPVVVRIPLIPECNADEAAVRGMAEIVRKCAPEAAVNLLPYHRYGASKYASVGREYTLEALRELTEDEKSRAADVFAEYGIKCEVSV